MALSTDLADSQEFIQNLRKIDPLQAPSVESGVILYGCGELGHLALDYCEKCGIRVEFFLDQTVEVGNSSTLLSHKIYNPNDAFSESPRSLPVAVCVATSSFQEIKNSLIKKGWKNIYPFYQLAQDINSSYPLSNGWLAGEITEADKSKISFILEHLADDCSRAHYRSFINWHTSYLEQINLEFPVIPSMRYNIEPIKEFLKSKSHIVIDIGSHHAQLMEIMLSEKLSIDEYHAFEPDPDSARITAQKLRTNPFAGFVYKNAVASQTKSNQKFFSGLNYSSKLSPYGNILVDTVSVDALGLKPTIIKYHVEGSELDCLQGSISSISKYRPLIMASLYHNRDGLCDTIHYFMSAHENYRCYLRSHSYQGTGLFLYALPLY